MAGLGGQKRAICHVSAAAGRRARARGRGFDSGDEFAHRSNQLLSSDSWLQCAIVRQLSLFRQGLFVGVGRLPAENHNQRRPGWQR